jgi:hypothetical protein
MVLAMTSPEHFKIDRSQRMHTGGVVVRVYQIFGTESFGWDTNREQPPSDRPRYGSREAAEWAADEALRLDGHVCDDGCYAWRLLG